MTVTREVTSTRERLVVEAAPLFAERGFHGTSVEDIGAQVGISGPAVYKHFSSKDRLLGEILKGISLTLLDGGQAVVSALPGDPTAALAALVEAHVEFALTRPDLIRIQDRDLSSLREEDGREVRRLQRAYVELWTRTIVAHEPGLAEERARTRAHAVFGLLNSTPHSARVASAAREELRDMAVRALGALPAPAPDGVD